MLEAEQKLIIKAKLPWVDSTAGLCHLGVGEGQALMGPIVLGRGQCGHWLEPRRVGVQRGSGRLPGKYL